AVALCQVGAPHLCRRGRALEALVAARRRGAALAAAGADPRTSARRRRAREAGRGAEDISRPRNGRRDAPRAGRAMGTLERVQRATASAIAGLVSPRRCQRHHVTGGFLAAPALVRLAVRALLYFSFVSL